MFDLQNKRLTESRVNRINNILDEIVNINNINEVDLIKINAASILSKALPVEVDFRINDIQWLDNGCGILPNGDMNLNLTSSDLDLGLTIVNYTKKTYRGTRTGYSIEVHEPIITDLLYRFDLEKDRNNRDEIAKKLKYKLTRQPANTRKGSRPRVFRTRRDAQTFCEEALLELQLVKGIVGMEDMPGVQLYDN